MMEIGLSQAVDELQARVKHAFWGGSRLVEGVGSTVQSMRSSLGWLQSYDIVA